MTRWLLVLLALAVLITSAGCSGYNDFWSAKADIKRAEAARVREETQHREAMHAITEANAAQAGPWLAKALLALVCGGVVIGLVYAGGQATAGVVKANVSARDVRPDARGFLPVRVTVVADTRPRGLLAAMGGQYGRDWTQIAEITNHATGQVRRRITAYSYATHQVTVRDVVVSEPDAKLLIADAQHRILALIADTSRKVARERGDASVTHALDTLRAQIQGLPGMSTPAALPEPKRDASPALGPGDGMG